MHASFKIIVMMTVKVLFFGMSRDLTNNSSVEMDLKDGLSVGIFRNVILEKYPKFKEMKNFAVAVNESYAEDEHVLLDNDILAVIPPVSGG